MADKLSRETPMANDNNSSGEKDMELDFQELSSDQDIVSRMTKFNEAVNAIEEAFKFSEDPELYEKLTNEQKIKYNHLLSFSLNGLYWMYLRAEGIDPNNHQIKAENERLKQSMARAKQIHDRNTIMPRLNVDAAQRFIRSGLWTPVQNQNEVEVVNSGENWDK
ncbi:nuclear nucleic acid-binding protein C1D [Copidosoma floridanum]|uniref:nuclear nucleic acid-binding protein C1D n=1 Tax=Copidosoma floridanum TaxID=29053 RepID=UPI0006C9DC4C|nr:nuclear nucleic acid-binding protein C1D [Copidosoma floridanum]